MSLFDEAEPGRSPSLRERAVVVTAFFVVASLLYRPWTLAPFDLLDFSEFIPRLRQEPSAWAEFKGLLTYYLGHGRFNPVVYAALVAKWEIFGDWTPGWQFARLGLMLLIVAQSYDIYRRLGAAAPAALLGCGVFLVAPTASPGWSRLSIGEPLGTAFLLWSASLAIRAREKGDPRSSFLLATAIVLLAMTKEMMLVCLVLPAALYLFPVRRQPVRPWNDHARVLLPAIVATIACVVVILWAYAQTLDSGYATEYGLSQPALWDVFPPWLFSFFPYDPFTGEAPALYTALAIGFLSTLFIGWRLFAEASPAHRRAAKTWTLLALVLPALIAIEYVPWPVFNRFYYFPALVTLGGLIAIASSGFLGIKGPLRFAPVVAIIGCYLAGVVQTKATADRAFASRYAVANMVRFVGTEATVDTFLVGARIVATGWKGLPETLRRYGPVVGVQLPPLVTTECAAGESAARDTAREVGYIAFASGCRVPSNPTRSFNEQYQRFSVASFALVRDSVRIDVVLPDGRHRQ